MKLIIFWSLIAAMTLLAMGLVWLPSARLKNKNNHKIVPFILMALPVSSLLLYLHWGSSQQLVHYWQTRKEVSQIETALANKKSLQALIQQLKAKLAQHQHSAGGWYWLGRLYLDLHQTNKAVKALEKTRQLTADSSVFNVAAANLLAIIAYNQKHYQRAIRYWEKLLPLFPAESKDSRALLSMIAKAQTKLQRIQHEKN